MLVWRWPLVVVLAVWGGGLAACDEPEGPARDLHLFLMAVQRGDVDAVWEGFSARTCRELDRVMARLTPSAEASATSRQMLIERGLIRLQREIVHIEPLGQTDHTAVLRLVDDLSQEQQVRMVLEGRRWRLDLDLPPEFRDRP